MLGARARVLLACLGLGLAHVAIPAGATYAATHAHSIPGDVDAWPRSGSITFTRASRRSLLGEAAVGEVPDGVKEEVESALGYGGGDDASAIASRDDGEGVDRTTDGITSFDLGKLEATPLKTTPFTYVVVERMVPPEQLRRINADFPQALLTTELANKKNVEERDVRRTGQVKGAYAKLIEDAKSRAFRDAIGKKLGLDLSKAFTRITLRGACQPKPCGGEESIHVDHQKKIVSILMYLNEDWPTGEEGAGGHLLLLKKPPDKKKKGFDALGDDNVYDEVKSYGGNMVVFHNNRSPKSNWVWHGLRTYVGLRRAIQINYCKTKTCN